MSTAAGPPVTLDFGTEFEAVGYRWRVVTLCQHGDLPVISATAIEAAQPARGIATDRLDTTPTRPTVPTNASTVLDESRAIGWALGIPHGWRLRVFEHNGRWIVSASGKEPMPCGHRSMRSSASSAPLAVAHMFRTIDFHRMER